ncbi:MAG: D-glucuronyl C5-epimerase family protein, partial [bacterium]
MISNISYYHIEQGVGKVFVPGLLRGYFNDLTGKRNWSGIVDKMGIPVCLLFDGSKTYFPTTIIQKALGHWDWYLLTNQKNELDEFLKICEWLIKYQNKKGGWEIAGELLPGSTSHFSAMPQGEAISTLVRAWQVTSDGRFLEAATKAYRLLVTPLEQGGTSNYISGELFLEELPMVPKNTILNGWIFALFGIYDFHLV